VLDTIWANMSNRTKWSHFAKLTHRPESWPVRVAAILACFAIGGFLVLVALLGIYDRTLWVTYFDPRFGHFIVQPTASLLLIAAFFIPLGVWGCFERR
jgi:uncharacterized RDD family membrane protein YckC